MTKRLLIPAIGVFFIVGCGSVYSVTPTPVTATSGIQYYLPKNRIEIQIPVTRTVTKAASFKDQAKACGIAGEVREVLV